MTEKLTTYDPAAALVNDEEIAFFLAEALQTNDDAYIAHALGVGARAKGMIEGRGYRIRLADIPEPYRTEFATASLGSTVEKDKDGGDPQQPS